MPTRSSAEDELESAIWMAMTAFKVTCFQPLEFIAAVQSAARLYAAGDSESLTALRREVLHRETAPNAHSSASERGGDR